MIGHFAIWKYDLFPFVKGGTITKVHPDGSVEVAEYGAGYRFTPQFVMPLPQGKRMLADLDRLTADYRTDLQELNSDYTQRAMHILPEGFKR